MVELLYGFMLQDGGRCRRKGWPEVLLPTSSTLFLFIFFANFLALIPASFSPTSQIAVTAFLALAVFLTVIPRGLVKNGASFLGLFWSPRRPLWRCARLLAIIELISFFVRPVSHSVRLAGAITAGHAVMKVFAGPSPQRP